MSDIYTGRGDEGKTDLWRSGERVSKSSERIAAYGTVDELIAFIGHAATHTADDVTEDLETVQQRLHVLMAQLADVREQGDKKISYEHVKDIERKIDEYEKDLPALDGFILPGGSHAGSLLHVARSVCRRAERRTVALADDEPVDAHVIMFLNRLSDLLFVLARHQNRVDGETERRVSYDA